MFSIIGKMAKLRPVKACIFDMDGLILDTETLYSKATQNILDETGVKRTYTWDVKQTLMGLQREEVSKRIVEIYDIPLTWEEYMHRQQEQIEILMQNAQLMPGAERLIRHLHDNDVPIALATSSGEDSVAVKTKHHQELFSLFHHKVMGSSDPEVKQGKPAPDIFLIAAQRFKEQVNPEECLVFEDAPNGVTAAVSAGMQCVMVPDEQISKDLCKHATVVLKSLEDFKPEDFGLPPFKS
ncbi:probable pseudouridine-5'-phosphatase [Culicoides brevitarsis]|uniref:probable pseudouridine-5'-phosphatase n=1 Tax=Culicoides brevitarsis TaxID=469753 RepID=UPI00307C33DB